MTGYEYKVIPAPTRGEKARGAKTPADRFALTLTNLMNEMGADGWEYIRADTLPAEERAGLTRKVTVYQNLLVFRRARVPAPKSAMPPLQLNAADPVPDTAPRVAIRDDTAPMPTIKLGAARVPLTESKPTSASAG